MNFGTEDNVMTQHTSNVSSSRSTTIRYDRSGFLEQCQQWRISRDEHDIYYVNLRCLNVFDAFRVRSRESANVTAAYHECRDSYKIMPP